MVEYHSFPGIFAVGLFFFNGVLYLRPNLFCLMHVVSHRPHAWYFLKEGDSNYLDVNCNLSAVGFDLIIKLNQDEYKEYHALGQVYIEYLAARVAYWWTEYSSRNCTSVEASVHDAIKAYANKGTPDA